MCRRTRIGERLSEGSGWRMDRRFVERWSLALLTSVVVQQPLMCTTRMCAQSPANARLTRAEAACARWRLDDVATRCTCWRNAVEAVGLVVYGHAAPSSTQTRDGHRPPLCQHLFPHTVAASPPSLHQPLLICRLHIAACTFPHDGVASHALCSAVSEQKGAGALPLIAPPLLLAHYADAAAAA